MNKLKLITWNVWFDLQDQDARITRICEIIKEKDPDIICLQEVTPYIYQLFKTHLESKYHFFPTIQVINYRKYGELIMTRKNITILDANILPFQGTKMGRQLNIIHLLLAKSFNDLNKELNLTIGTVHLESCWQFHKERKKQFDYSIKYLSQFPNAILTGDTNFTGHGIKLPSDWIDVWESLGSPTNCKYTYDWKSNSRIKGKYRARLDRVYSNADISFNGIQLLGVDDENSPSDHYGILTSFIVE